MEIVDKKIIVLKALLLTIIAVIGILLYDVFINDFELIREILNHLEQRSI